MADSLSRRFADLSQYTPDKVAARAALARQANPLDAIIQGAQQGYQLSQLPQLIQQQRADALNNQLLSILKESQIRGALQQQGIFMPTAASGDRPAALPAIPLTFEEQRAINPYLPNTPEAVAAQQPVVVPESVPLQDVRIPLQLGSGAVQAPEIQRQNLNEAIRQANAQAMQKALSKPMVVGKDKTLILPRGLSGQSEVLYSPPVNQEAAQELDTGKLKQLNTIQDNLNQVPAYKNYTNIQEEQKRMEAALKVGKETGKYFGADLALADQFIRGVQGNYAIRQGTQKILLSEQPLINRLYGNMIALVNGTGGQGFTNEDREQLLKLSKAFANTSLEELKPWIQPAFEQMDALKIPRKYLFGGHVADIEAPTEESLSTPSPGAAPITPAEQQFINKYRVQ